MDFASDNSGPVHPDVMQALSDANEGYDASYGDDALMGEVRDGIRDLFEAPDAAVYLVATGTAANVLALSTLCQPWHSIFCTSVAHIHEDECNAAEFWSGGAKLILIDSKSAKLDATDLARAIKAEGTRGVHGTQRGAVCISQVSERGTVYSVEELAAISQVAKSFGLPVYMDGARFANACVALGCTPAQMSWKAGIDAISFGGTKNGLMGVEAVIFFDPKHAWEFELRRKRGAQLFSKHRYLSAQMAATLKDNLWHDMASRANAGAARLSRGLAAVPSARIDHKTDANMVYASLPRTTHARLFDAGATYHLGPDIPEGDAPETLVPARFVVDWSQSDATIDRFIALAAD